RGSSLEEEPLPTPPRARGRESLEGAFLPGGDVCPADAGLAVEGGAHLLRELVEGRLVRPGLQHHPLVRMLAVAVALQAAAAHGADPFHVLVKRAPEPFPIVGASTKNDQHLPPPEVSVRSAAS